MERDVTFASSGSEREGILALPAGASGVVLFAHGSGSGRQSPRNQHVAGILQEAGLGTLLFDLLDERETADRRNVFDIDLLADRLLDAAAWLRQQPETRDLPIGYFGASTGAGRPCRRRRALPSAWERSSRAAGAPTWQTNACRGLRRRRC